MQKNFWLRVKKLYADCKQSRATAFINRCLDGPWGLAVLAAFTLCAYAFSLELVLYGFVAVLCIYVALFAKDFLCLMSLFVFCYIASSRSNNPGLTSESVFYTGSGGIFILAFAAVAVAAMFTRIALDKNMGYKKLFTQKRKLLLGMFVLTAAYLLSGIGSAHYSEIFAKNWLFAFLQFASIVVLYFLFSATVTWDERCVPYFAWLGVFMGVVTSLEVFHVYLTQPVIVGGVINRTIIYTGWGTYNNVGAIIAMSIPFAFYLASKSKRPYLFILVAVFLEIGLIFSCSRGSILGGTAAFIAGFVLAFLQCDHKRIFRLSTYIILGVIAVGLAASLGFFKELFQAVPSIVESSEGGVQFNDSSRFSIYKEGFKVFGKYPIFGESFYPTDYAPWEFSKVEELSSLIPPRWHNTIVQLAASCGIVGLLAYAFHRYQTVKLIVQKRTRFNLFIAIAIVALLGMSMLDCHFFNLGPVLFYSMALAVAENAEEKTTE